MNEHRKEMKLAKKDEVQKEIDRETTCPLSVHYPEPADWPDRM